MWYVAWLLLRSLHREIYLTRLLLTEEDQNHLWNIERWEIGSGSVRKRHALLKSLSGNYRFMSVRRGHTHRVDASINQKRLTAESKPFRAWPTGDFNSEDRQCHPGVRSGRQHRSIFRKWVLASNALAAVVRLPYRPPNYPTILQSFVTGGARSTGSNFASFICNQRGCCLIERRYNRSQFKRVKFQRN